LVRFHGEKKEELLGVAANRVMRMNLQTGDHVKTWRYSTMKVSRQGIMSRHGDIQLCRSVDKGLCQDMDIFNHEGQKTGDHVKTWRYSTMKVSRQGIMSRRGDIQP
jgi:hypothetical protein